MTSKQFVEFLTEFPAEFRHAHPLFEVLSRYANKILSASSPRTSSSPSSSSNQSNAPSLRLLEYGSGFGEHAVYYSHLIRQGAFEQHKQLFENTNTSVNCTADESSHLKEKKRQIFYEYLASLQHRHDYGASTPSPFMTWQPTEVNFAFPSLETTCAKWRQLAPKEVGRECVLPPLELDVLKQEQWQKIASSPGAPFDLILTVNTFHIVSEEHCFAALEGVAKCLRKPSADGRPSSFFLAYGPFRVDGKQTAASNVRFEEFLKRTYGPQCGIRDIGVLKKYCEDKLGLTIVDAIKMPEENFVLVFSHDMKQK